MLPRLREWSQKHKSGALRLVVISTGTVEENQRMRIDSSILLDHDQTSMRLLGAAGTPSALLVDAKGAVASKLAIGADAIFDLVERPIAKPSGTNLQTANAAVLATEGAW
jgi:hypothetical protein